MHSVAASRCTAWTKVILPSQVWKLKAVLYVCFMWIHVLQFFGSIHFQLSRTRLEVCSLWLHPQARICGREKGTDKGRSYRNRNSSRSLQWPIKVKIFSGINASTIFIWTHWTPSHPDSCLLDSLSFSLRSSRSSRSWVSLEEAALTSTALHTNLVPSSACTSNALPKEPGDVST